MERDNLPGVRTTCLEKTSTLATGTSRCRGGAGRESEAHLQTSAGGAEALGCSWARAAGEAPGGGESWVRWGELGADADSAELGVCDSGLCELSRGRSGFGDGSEITDRWPRALGRKSKPTLPEKRQAGERLPATSAGLECHAPQRDAGPRCRPPPDRVLINVTESPSESRLLADKDSENPGQFGGLRSPFHMFEFGPSRPQTKVLTSFKRLLSLRLPVTGVNSAP